MIAAAVGASTNIKPDLRASIVEPPGGGSFPISGFTWALAYKHMDENAKR